MTGRRSPPWLPPRGLLGGAVAYGLVATLFDPYTAPMRVATAIPYVVVVVVAVRRRVWPAGSPPTSDRRALAVWLVLIAAALAFQLGMYLSAPRADHPTLSSLASIAFGWPAVRPAAFAAWLWLGWYLLDR